MTTSGKRRARRSAEKKPSKAASPKQLKIAFSIFGVIVAVIALAIALAPERGGRVWSEEHGHWHDADGNELP